MFVVLCFIVFMKVIFFIFPRLLVAGDSAGGNLTASLTLKTIQVVRLELEFDIWLGFFPRYNFLFISEIQRCPPMRCLDFAKLGWNWFETTNLMKIYTFVKAHPSEYFPIKLVTVKMQDVNAQDNPRSFKERNMKRSHFQFPVKKIYFPLCTIRCSLTQMGIRRPDGVMLSYAALLIQCVHILIFPIILIIITYNVFVITIIFAILFVSTGS